MRRGRLPWPRASSAAIFSFKTPRTAPENWPTPLPLRALYPGVIETRYKFTPDPEKNGFELLEDAGRKRGFLVSGGEVDIERMANTLLSEYHEGKLGRLSLEATPAE